MITAQEVKKFQEQKQERLIEEVELTKIKKEILEAIIKDGNTNSVYIIINSLSIVAKLKELGFNVEDRSGYGYGLWYIVSWGGGNG